MIIFMVRKIDKKWFVKNVKKYFTNFINERKKKVSINLICYFTNLLLKNWVKRKKKDRNIDEWKSREINF